MYSTSSKQSTIATSYKQKQRSPYYIKVYQLQYKGSLDLNDLFSKQKSVDFLYHHQQSK